MVSPCSTGRVVSGASGKWSHSKTASCASEPNVLLLHEMLHNYESFQTDRLGFYDGLSGAHGAGIHGYPRDADGELDFIKCYRAFLRGQVAETAAMREEVVWTGPRPDDPAAWVGVFETIRHGLAW